MSVCRTALNQHNWALRHTRTGSTIFGITFWYIPLRASHSHVPFHEEQYGYRNDFVLISYELCCTNVNSYSIFTNTLSELITWGWGKTWRHPCERWHWARRRWKLKKLHSHEVFKVNQEKKVCFNAFKNVSAVLLNFAISDISFENYCKSRCSNTLQHKHASLHRQTPIDSHPVKCDPQMVLGQRKFSYVTSFTLQCQLWQHWCSKTLGNATMERLGSCIVSVQYHSGVDNTLSRQWTERDIRLFHLS